MIRNDKMVDILIVDDEPEISMVAASMLKKAGYENVDDVWNGEECLKKLKEKNYDLVLLDVMMHGDDGWEVCKKIKADDKTKHIPVIMFTVRTGADSRKKGIECGADDQIDKPFEGTALLDTVKRVLEKTKP